MLMRFHATSLLTLLPAALLTFAPQRAIATTHNWPDNSQFCHGPIIDPVNGTVDAPGVSLQGCIDTYAAAGDTILIGAGADNYANDLSPVGQVVTINEDIVIKKNITIAAMNGFDAVFTPGHSITINSPATGAMNVSLSRLYMPGGHVTINHSSNTSSTYALSGLRFSDVDANASTPCAISFNDSGSGLAYFNVGDSELDFTAPRSGTQPSGICATGLSSANWSVDLFRNRFVTSRAALTNAIVVSGPNTGKVWVENNQIRGNDQYGILASGNGQTLWIHDNVVTGSTSAGIYANEVNSTSTVVNNTVVQDSWGLMVMSSGSGSARVANNLVAFNSGYGVYASGTSNAYNLLFGNGMEHYVSGPGDVLSNPMLVSNANPHLTAASPARNAGNIGDVTNPVFIVPAADADGETRVLWNSPTRVDIGAYEFSSDYSGATTATVPYIWNNYITAIVPLPVASNGMPVASEQLLATTVASNATYATDWAGSWGVYQDSASPTQWTLYKEDEGINLDSAGIAGDSFNVFAPRDGRYHTQVTTVTGASSCSTTASSTAFISGDTAIICDPHLNGAPWVTAFATHDWTPTARTYNNHPVGMYYDGTNWRIRLEDTTPMPSGLTFNVVVGPLTVNAYTVRVDSLPVSAIVLYNPKLDNNPCAAPIVTATDTGSYYGNGVGVLDSVPFGVKYVPASLAGGAPGDPGHWEIVPALEAGFVSYFEFPAYSAFNVMVDGPQADTCGM